MVAAATLSHFLATFGDCAPANCEGYFGTWATTARFSQLIVALGYAVLGVALAALYLRIAQFALVVVALAMLATVALSFVFDLRDFWLPGPDVWLGQFTIVFVFQVPAAVLWLGGAIVGLLIPRATAAHES